MKEQGLGITREKSGQWNKWQEKEDGAKVDKNCGSRWPWLYYPLWVCNSAPEYDRKKKIKHFESRFNLQTHLKTLG